MRVRNKKGLTAMVDAMIFIVILGLAASAMFAFNGDDPEPNDASSITDSIFSSKLRACDVIDTNDSRLIGMPDIAALCILTEDDNIKDYLGSILDSLLQRPGSYSLSIDYMGESVTIGSGKGEAVSGSVKEFIVTYGGTITVDLNIY